MTIYRPWWDGLSPEDAVAAIQSMEQWFTWMELRPGPYLILAVGGGNPTNRPR